LYHKNLKKIKKIGLARGPALMRGGPDFSTYIKNEGRGGRPALCGPNAG